jgi:hypothetical protein
VLSLRVRSMRLERERLRGGQVSDYRYAKDPAFDDNSEWISCACGREYDRKEYNSDTCIECENELTNKQMRERASK